ncbi:anaerobic ribonucleoside-triphosphate reductase activating protein [bacterium]|nr:anaerobic ribonucleoside-triphosphate reductase activating protein [bacterium]
MLIGGLEKTSLLDYPDKISCIIFTYGCNLRCPYCHNPELVIDNIDKDVRPEYVLEFLKERIGKLDGVVITGGEPLIQEDILQFMEQIKKIGYSIKLDTNGLLPDKLQQAIDKKLVDYIAMDIKYPKAEYLSKTGIKDIEDRITKSIKIIKKSHLPYEFRTTYVKGIHTMKSAESICKMIKGCRLYYIQNFRSGKSIDNTLDATNSFTQEELQEILAIAQKYIKNAYIR